jgi:uncharacterized HAD superfamily protein
MKKKSLCFDIDNTICSTVGNNYKKSKPKKEIIKLINNLFDLGHEVNIFTARYMGRNKNDILKAKKNGYKMTKKQLDNWGVKYNKLFFGKPSADLYIDDKSICYQKNFIIKSLSNLIKN